jgi:hypothetical protein
VLCSIEALRETFNETLNKISGEVKNYYSVLLENSRTVHDVSLVDLQEINDKVVSGILTAQKFVSTELETQLK